MKANNSITENENQLHWASIVRVENFKEKWKKKIGDPFIEHYKKNPIPYHTVEQYFDWLEKKIMKKEFEIWNEVSIGYWNSKEFIQDRIKQQFDWMDKLSVALKNGIIGTTRFDESKSGARAMLRVFEERLKELNSALV